MTKYLGIHRVLLLTTILAVNAYAMKQDPAEWDDAVKSKAIDMLTAGQSKDDVAKYLVDQDFDASVKANPVTYKAIQDWLQTLTKNPKVNEVADVQFMLEKTAGGKKQDPNKSLGDVFASIKNKKAGSNTALTVHYLAEQGVLAAGGLTTKGGGGLGKIFIFTTYGE